MFRRSQELPACVTVAADPSPTQVASSLLAWARDIRGLPAIWGSCPVCAVLRTMSEPLGTALVWHLRTALRGTVHAAWLPLCSCIRWQADGRQQCPAPGHRIHKAPFHGRCSIRQLRSLDTSLPWCKDVPRAHRSNCAAHLSAVKLGHDPARVQRCTSRLPERPSPLLAAQPRLLRDELRL